MIHLDKEKIIRWLKDDVLLKDTPEINRVACLTISKCEREANIELKKLIKLYPEVSFE